MSKGSNSATVTCGPIPELVNLSIRSERASGGDETFVLNQETKLWPNQSTISYSFFGAQGAQKSAVNRAFSEYCRYANLRFTFVGDDNESAKIRIAFEGTQAWSTIGTDALRFGEKYTMNLGAVDDESPSERDFSIVLHEIGHALGLVHESEGRENDTQKTTSNFPKLDGLSIMRAKAGASIPANAGLSDYDKAWLSLNYPGKNTEADGHKWTPLHSITVLNIPSDVAADILLSTSVSEKRLRYEQYITRIHGPTPSQASTQEGVNSRVNQQIAAKTSSKKVATPEFSLMAAKVAAPEAAVAAASADAESSAVEGQDGDIDQALYDVFAAAVLNPRFRETLVNLATHDLPNHGVKLAEYPIQAAGIQSSVQSAADIQQGLLGLLGPILTQVVGGVLGAGIQANGLQANGLQANGNVANAPLPENIQQGIFSVVSSFMKNPIFTEVVTNIAKTAVQAL